MKAIFVPIDFSKIAENALPVAASIALNTGAKIILHHNVQTLARWNALSRVEQDQHKEVLAETREAEIKLNMYLCRGDLRSLNCQKLITYGITYEEIISNARNLRADLIVMGSPDNIPGGKPFIDSTIQKVLRKSTVPVLSVRGPRIDFSWRKLLVPLSFNEDIHKAFNPVHDLALELNSIVHLLFVNRPDKFKETSFIEKQIANFTEHYPDLKFEYGVLDSYEMEKGILAYADKIRPSCIVMLTHDHRHQAKYLISTTESVMAQANLPVIGIPILTDSAVRTLSISEA
jgi:nucleotide-binding universal stress UspA family protein